MTFAAQVKDMTGPQNARRAWTREEARALYDDLSPPEPRQSTPADPGEQRPAGAGRPTKADRRATDRLKGE